MTLDEYEVRVARIAAECLARSLSAHEVVLAQPDRRDLAALRFELLVDADLRGCAGLLETGLVPEALSQPDDSW